MAREDWGLAAARCLHERARWQTLRVEFTGPRFRVALNGQELFVVENGTFPDPGTVGLWTKADSVTWFDDYRYGTR